MNWNRSQVGEDGSCNHIHSGVRVRIPSKFSSIPHHFQSNRIQTMIKHLWLESEASALSEQGEKPVETIDCILKKNSPWKKSFPNRDLKEKIWNTIAVQTITIEQIDREISCQLIKNHRSRTSSSISSSASSTSNDHSSQTETSSNTSTHSNTTDESHAKNLDKIQQNNNANIERVNMEDGKREKPIKQLRKTPDDLQNINSSVMSSARKGKRLFDPIFNLISSFRSRWMKHAMFTRQNENAKIRSSTSRCRRSVRKKRDDVPQTSSSSKEKTADLSLRSIINQSLPLPSPAIHLHANNKNVLFESPSSIDHSIEFYQKNLIGEFQTLLLH